MIIGINTSHDVSFCVLDGRGRLLWLLEEERFNRFKHTDFFSFHALAMLIEDGLLDPGEVGVLSYSFENDGAEIVRLEQKREENVRRHFGAGALKKARHHYCQREPIFSAASGLGRSRGFEETDSSLRALFPGATVESHNHHRTHAASAFYPSPFNESAVLVVDGAGRLETASIWRGNAAGLTLLEQTELPHSLGIFYWLVAHLLALEEGQVMGLASYGVPRFEGQMWEHLIALDPQGGFYFKAPLVFWGDMDCEWACEEFLLRIPIRRRRSRAEPLTQEHADFAASAQQVTEEILLHLARRSRAVTGSEHLCLAGGVMQNCVALGRILCSGTFERYWIQPATHDAGSAWGAALLAGVGRGLDRCREEVDTAFLGRGVTDKEIEEAIAVSGVDTRRCENPAERAAGMLAVGGAIGWVRGRAEVGPRALGGRSLLAHPQFAFNHFRLNRIKSREAWRPLAPVFAEEDLPHYMSEGAPSPHMNLSFAAQEETKKVLPAAVHVDGTARIQTVRPDDPGGLFSILQALRRAGYEPAIINTSLNAGGEPLVQSALDALRLFLIGELDALFLGEWLVEGRPPLSDLQLSALKANPHLDLYRRLLRGRAAVLLYHPASEPLTRRARLLAASLTWLGTDVQLCRGEELCDVVASTASPVLLTCAPSVDLRTLPERLSPRVRESPWLLVSDNLYPTQLSFGELRGAVGRNLSSFVEHVASRRLVLWMPDELRELFSLELPELAADSIAYSEAAPLLDRDALFLVLSNDVYAANKQMLEGYHPYHDYAIWTVPDSN
jgi:carbamoyltransferase